MCASVTAGSSWLARRRSRAIAIILLGVVVAVAYLGNNATLGSGDTRPARHLPVSILIDGDFYLDEFSSEYEVTGRHAVRLVRGHLVSSYPVGAPILALPFYVPPLLLGLQRDRPTLETLEKISATGIVMLSATFVLLFLLRLTTPGASLVITAVYALGTSSFSVSSQALWQHGPGQLAVAASLYCLVRGSETRYWLALAGFPMAFAALCRPTNVLLVAPLALYVLVRHPRWFPGLVACGLPVGFFILWYNLSYLGTAFYSQFEPGRDELWRTPFWEGLAGLLISPGRGLFVYSPILLLSILGFARSWRARTGDNIGFALLRYSSVGVLCVVLAHSRWWSWWGGLCYGPRLLADTLPVFCLALYPVAAWVLDCRGRCLLAAGLVVWSCAAHFSGAYWDDGRWTGYDLPGGLWSWRDNPLTNPGRVLLGHALIGLRNLPTSETHPEDLACSYIDEETARVVRGRTRAGIQVAVTAVNTGTAVWIAWPKHARSSVGLHWELRPVGLASAIARQGRVVLRHDVFPGEAHRFSIPVSLPRKAGEYELRVDLESNDGPRFSDIGSPPKVIPVSVTRPGRGRGAPPHRLP